MNPVRCLLTTWLVFTGLAQAAPGPDLTGVVKTKEGRPVAGAGVFIHTAGPRVGFNPLCPSCYADCRKSDRSDAQGRFAIPLLDDALLFRVLVVAKGYQPTFVSKVDPARGPIEAVLTPLNAALGPKHQLKGRVIGPDNQPLANAVVSFETYYSGDGGQGGNVPGFDPLAVTDEAGEFLLTGDKPFDSMDVEVWAPGFAKKHFRELASGGKRHELAVTEGGSLSGRVLQNGKPLAGVAMGMVSVDRSDDFSGEFEFATHADGRFLFVNLPPNQDYYLYGLMDSFRPHGAIAARKVRVNGDGSITNIGTLDVQPGVRLAGQVVLADGGKVPPQTQLMVSRSDAWDSTFVELGADGRFDFRNIPPGPLSMNVTVAGYRFAARNASLDPLNPWHIVGRVSQNQTNLLIRLEPGSTLPPNRNAYAVNEADRLENRPLRGAEPADPASHQTITGRVVDAETKAPIAAFMITPGREHAYPNRAGVRPPPARPPSWEAHLTSTQTDGQFTVALERRSTRPVLKVEADGYLPALSPPLELTQTAFAFELRRGTGPRGRLLLPDGKPVVGVNVLMLEETEQASLGPEGQLHYHGLRNLPVRTDAEGRFAFPPRVGSTLVVAADERGFVRASDQELAAKPELLLAPWSRVTGRLLAGGKPLAGERMSLAFAHGHKPNQPYLNFTGGPTTGAGGTFTFERVPAGTLQLVILVPLQDGPRGWSHSPQRMLVTKPGETLVLELEKDSGGAQ